jgi:hypothetical protein
MFVKVAALQQTAVFREALLGFSPSCRPNVPLGNSLRPFDSSGELDPGLNATTGNLAAHRNRLIEAPDSAHWALSLSLSLCGSTIDYLT